MAGSDAQLRIKPKSECRWDLVSLGEVMLRLDPGDTRIATTRSFRAWEGGGEYNVARGLKRCFGMDTAVVTALADNPIGRLIQDLIYQGGVDQSHVRWVPYDGVGRTVRNGLNFTERGFGIRAAVGCSDRGNTAASQLRPGDIKWDQIFGEERARWFHTGGIFAALSESTPLVAREAMQAARSQGTVISYDLNYRESLWKAIGGRKRATEVNRELVSNMDVLIGNEEDFTAALGFEVEGADENLAKLDVESFRRMLERVTKEFPNLKVIATTLRHAKTATINDWSAVCYCSGQLYRAQNRENLEIYDRIGGTPLVTIGNIRDNMLNRLLSTSTLNKLIQFEAEQGSQAYTITEMFSDIKKGIWSELTTKKKIDVYRRNLQKSYVNILSEIIAPPKFSETTIVINFGGTSRPQLSADKSDIKSLVRAHLVSLRNDIKAAIPATTDEMSKYHLQDVVTRIDKALNPKD